jgi:2-aminobenzoate-CoA ligase
MTQHERDSFVEDRLPTQDAQPEFLFELPELQYPERMNAARELLAGGSPQDVAVLNDRGAWSYGELSELSGQIGTVLRDRHSLVPGNRVLLVGPNSMKLFASWLGILHAGGVVVATMPILRAQEIAKVVAKARITHAIVHEDCREVVERAAQDAGFRLKTLVFGADGGDCDLSRLARTMDAAPPVNTGRDDPALIAFTSGTTGVPKGCVHFHRDILASADSFARHVLKPRPGLRWTSSAPLAFTFGLGMQFVFPLRSGGTAVTPTLPGPKGVMEAIAKHKVEVCATAPTAYRVMLEQLDEHDLSSLEICVSAGEHLPKATWREWKEHTGIELIDGIGATEMMHVFISASGADIRPGATGKVVPGYVARVLDENGRLCEVGTGRLAVKGPTGCRYLDDERQREYVIDGWNVTGDAFRRDEEGYFWYVARSDDMIVSSGYNIAAPEVEEALYSHPAVTECAVIGVPCEKRGQLVKAFVVPGDGVCPDEALRQELQNHAKQVIAPYKYPREIAFVEQLPKTPTGKIRRFELRAEG